MQVDAILPGRLSVVGHVQHRTIDTALALPQQFDDQCQIVVGIGNRVVIGIDDLLWRAIRQLVALACGLEALECRRIALEVGWPVASLLVQDDHVRSVPGIERAFQPVDQDVIEATGGIAIGRIGGFR
jgi:hypothetical protein